MPQIWAQLLAAERKRYLLAGSVPEQAGDLQTEVGLVEAHAYAFLDVRELPSGDRLVKIRNPWGKTEWKGAWSDSSELWTDKLKRELGWSNEDGTHSTMSLVPVYSRPHSTPPPCVRHGSDGTFWMAWEDILHYFDEVCIVRAHDDYLYMAVELPELSHEDFVGVEIVVDTPVKGTIELHQPSKRRFPKHGDGFEYGGLTFTVHGIAAAVAAAHHCVVLSRMVHDLSHVYVHRSLMCQVNAPSLLPMWSR